MGKRGIVLLLVILVFLFVGCEEGNKIYTNEIKGDWVDVDNNWEDSEGSYLGYVEGESGNHLDLRYRIDPLDDDTSIMGFIEEYTYSNGKLKGKYTTSSEDSAQDITITFSYSAPTLHVVVVANGALGNKTLNLTAAP